MLLINDKVRVVNTENKHFGKAGVVKTIRDNGIITVSFGGKGRPSLFKMTDVEEIVAVDDTNSTN